MRYPTNSHVIRVVHCVQVVLHMRVSESDKATLFANGLMHSLTTRFPGFETEYTPAHAILAHPRYKDVCYTEDS